MKTTKQFNNRLKLMAQSGWLGSSAMTLALATVFLGLVGCSAPHH